MVYGLREMYGGAPFLGMGDMGVEVRGGEGGWCVWGNKGKGGVGGCGCIYAWYGDLRFAIW